MRNPGRLWDPGATHLQGMMTTTAELRLVSREGLAGAEAARPPPQPLVDAAPQAVGARSGTAALQVRGGERRQGLRSAVGEDHPTSVSPGRGAGLATAASGAHFAVLLSISPRVLAERLSLSSRRA